MKKLYYLLPLLLLLGIACEDDMLMPPANEGDLSDIPYNPEPYIVVTSSNMGELEIPADNPLTKDGVLLGRHLFYDPILSGDSTMSCSSCHLPVGSFTDNKAISPGIDGVAGTRSSMSLLNVGYYTKGLFWDGRTATLEEQALQPIEDPIELHNTLPGLITKLKAHDDYPSMFRKAFGIENKSEITDDLVAKSIAQFERIMVSSGQSRYDILESGGMIDRTDEEILGQDLFRVELGSVDHPGCDHCHTGSLLTDNTYKNNGLEQVDDLNGFPDKGYGAVTGNLADNGTFRVPTLKNIELTAPYMHDGRFETLEEVIDHYASGGHPADNVPTFFQSFSITDEQKGYLIAYMKMFTDTAFVNNPDLQNPFE